MFSPPTVTSPQPMFYRTTHDWKKEPFLLIGIMLVYDIPGAIDKVFVVGGVIFLGISQISTLLHIRIS